MVCGFNRVTHAHLGPSDLPYSPNQFLALDFFAVSYRKTTLEHLKIEQKFQENACAHE